MKFKALALVAITSFTAASISFAAPANTAADDASAGLTAAAPSANDANNVGSMQNTDLSMATPADSSNALSANENGGSSNTADEMSADTATGDDDY